MLSSFKWQNGKHRQNTLVSISNCIKMNKLRLSLKINIYNILIIMSQYEILIETLTERLNIDIF